MCLRDVYIIAWFANFCASNHHCSTFNGYIRIHEMNVLRTSSNSRFFMQSRRAINYNVVNIRMRFAVSLPIDGIFTHRLRRYKAARSSRAWSDGVAHPVWCSSCNTYSSHRSRSHSCNSDKHRGTIGSIYCPFLNMAFWFHF